VLILIQPEISTCIKCCIAATNFL